jgi:threonine synthase
MTEKQSGVWRWADWLPKIPGAARLSRGEGATPLVRAQSIGRAEELKIYFKLESGNPTGSYKDRFAALAVSQMLSDGVARCLATSSGNTGAALAAYCAAAKIVCEIAVVETAPSGKLQQMQTLGAEIYRVRGFGLDAKITEAVMRNLAAREAAGEGALQISAYRFSPVGMAGVQTISYELAEAGDFDHVFVPAGGGGLALAVARGYEVAARRGNRSTPRIECAQPEGNDTIASPLRDGLSKARPVVCTSQISGLQVAGVIDGDETIAACRASGGSGHVVSDEEIWAAQRAMAREEGLWCEPAGAVALAAALRARREGRLHKGARVVCLVTGGGWKDEASLQALAGAPPETRAMS